MPRSLPACGSTTWCSGSSSATGRGTRTAGSWDRRRRGQGQAARASRPPELRPGSSTFGLTMPRRFVWSVIPHERLDRVEARVRALADPQVTAVRDQPERRAQAAGELEAVLEEHPVVAGAPEDEARARDALEIDPRVVADERATEPRRVRVQGGAGEEPFDRRGRESRRVGRAPPTEREVTERRPARDRCAERRKQPAGPSEREQLDRPGRLPAD